MDARNRDLLQIFKYVCISFLSQPSDTLHVCISFLSQPSDVLRWPVPETVWLWKHTARRDCKGEFCCHLSLHPLLFLLLFLIMWHTEVSAFSKVFSSFCLPPPCLFIMVTCIWYALISTIMCTPELHICRGWCPYSLISDGSSSHPCSLRRENNAAVDKNGIKGWTVGGSLPMTVTVTVAGLPQSDTSNACMTLRTQSLFVCKSKFVNWLLCVWVVVVFFVVVVLVFWGGGACACFSYHVQPLTETWSSVWWRRSFYRRRRR